MDTLRPKSGLRVLGIGAAACAACCAGPLLTFLAGAGIASLLGAVVFGVAGLVAVLAIAAVVVLRRLRRSRRCTPAAAPVSLHAPELKPRATPADSATPGW